MPRRKLSDTTRERRLDLTTAASLEDDESYQTAQRESDARALRLRAAGADYRDIARALGFAGPSGAHQAVAREMRRRLVEPADDLREIELLRLERMHAALWQTITAYGQPAKDGEVGITFDQMEKAVARLLQVMRRRAELKGLDAPKKVDITHQIREMAIAEGLDPDQAVRDAEMLIARAG